MKTAVLALTTSSLCACTVAGCGGGASVDTAAPPIPAQPSAADAPEVVAQSQQPPGSSRCREPSGQEKFSLRFQVRKHDRELLDEPWALVRKDGVNFMAADIDASDTGLSVPLTVLVSFPQEGRYLAGMKAINGTARTFTDLPERGDLMPKGGERAMDCLDEER